MRIFKIFAISIALILLLAFTIHAIDFDHHHPSGIWMGVEDALHSMDRKLFVIIVLSAFAIVLSRVLSRALELFVRKSEQVLNEIVFNAHFSLFNPIKYALRRGILHPQVY